MAITALRVAAKMISEFMEDKAHLNCSDTFGNPQSACKQDGGATDEGCWECIEVYCEAEAKKNFTESKYTGG